MKHEVGEPRPGVNPTDRFLASVEARLRMPDEASGPLLDELADHIEDAIETLMRDGLTPDEAEREALARLGSPKELGDDLRRTHQTRRRLLAAAGGGLWQAAQGAVRGYLGGMIVALPLMFGAALLSLALGATFGSTISDSNARDLFTLLVFPSIWGATWLGARYLVEAVSTRSRRAIDSIRRPIALIGGAIVGILVVLMPAEQTHISVALALATPFLFAAGASTAGRDIGDRIGGRTWASRMRGLRRIVFVGFVIVVIGSMAASMVASRFSEPTIEAPGSMYEEPTGTSQQRWTAMGFDSVAPTVIDLDEYFLSADFPRDGFVVVGLADDLVDWDEWAGLQLEVWAATAPRNVDGNQALIGGTPMGVLPVIEAWSTDKIAVKVGYPDAEGFLLFLVARDPNTGERVAFGRPSGDESRFHGSLLDWFGSQ